MAAAENQAHPDGLAQSKNGADCDNVRQMHNGFSRHERSGRRSVFREIKMPDSLAFESKIAVHSKNPLNPGTGGEQCFSLAPYDLFAEHCLGTFSCITRGQLQPRGEPAQTNLIAA
jgi:hypothetical protein